MGKERTNMAVHRMLAVAAVLAIAGGCGGGGSVSPEVTGTLETPKGSAEVPARPPAQETPEGPPEVQVPEVPEEAEAAPTTPTPGDVTISHTQDAQADGTLIVQLRISWAPEPFATRVVVTDADGNTIHDEVGIGAGRSVRITEQGTYTVSAVHVPQSGQGEGEAVVRSYTAKLYSTIPGLESLSLAQYGAWGDRWSSTLYARQYARDELELAGLNGMTVTRRRDREGNVVVGVWGRYVGFSVFGDLEAPRSDDRHNLTGTVPGALTATYTGAAAGLYRDGRAEFGRVKMELRSDGTAFSPNTTLDIHITELQHRSDVSWRNVGIGNGVFSGQNNPNSTVRGAFYGPNHEEAGGSFVVDDLRGGFVVAK